MNPTNPPPPSPDDDLKKVIARIESFNDALAAFRAEIPKPGISKSDLETFHIEITAETRREISEGLSRRDMEQASTDSPTNPARKAWGWPAFIAIGVAVMAGVAVTVTWFHYRERVSQLEQQVAASQNELREISEWQAIMVRDWQRILKTHSTQGRRP